MAFRGRVLAPVLITLTVVLAVTGLVASPASAAPVVTSFTPTSGGVGSPVTITGSGFTSVTSVKFNATAAIYTVVSATQIKTTVPAGATTGKISVTAGGVTGTSSTNFTVTLGSAVAPAAGPPTSKVTVNGSGFGPNEAVDVYAGTTDVALAVADANGNVSATTAVPSSAPPGPFWFTLVGRRTGNASQASFTVRTNVTQAGFGPGKTGANPYENQIDGQDLDLVWSQPGSRPPVIVNGVVVTVTESTNSVDAYSTAGVPRWSQTLLNLAATTPAVIGNTVVVGGTDGSVRGLSLATGVLLWTRALGTSAPVDQPLTVTSTGIYAEQTDGHVTALTSTGAISWSKSMANPSTGAGSAASVAAGLLITGDDDGNYYAWSLATGDQQWMRSISTNPVITPVISGNLIIASDTAHKVIAINLDSGSLDWSTSDPQAGQTPPAVANGRVFFSIGQTDALSRSTGAAKWSSATITTPSSQPFVADGIVWVAGGSSQYFGLDAYSGTVATSVGSFTLDNRPAVVADGELYTISSNTRRLNVFAPPSPANPSARPDLTSLHPDHALRAQR